jgi:hypothetical protein
VAVVQTKQTGKQSKEKIVLYSKRRILIVQFMELVGNFILPSEPARATFTMRISTAPPHVTVSYIAAMAMRACVKSDSEFGQSLSGNG